MNEERIKRLSWVAKECGGGQLEDDLNAAISALSQQSQDCDLSGLPMIIAGALYDFAGYLTTRPVSMKYGASELAGPMIDALKEWAAMRGLPLDDAAVQSWQEHITRAADQVNAEDYSKVPMGPVGATYIGDTILPAPQSSQPDTVAVPVELIDGFPELNLANYNDDDVAALNNWGIEVVLLRTAQEGKK